jgi:hypothetical protein
VIEAVSARNCRCIAILQKPCLRVLAAKTLQGFALYAQNFASERCKACNELSRPNLDAGQFLFVFFFRNLNDGRVKL